MLKGSAGRLYTAVVTEARSFDHMALHIEALGSAKSDEGFLDIRHGNGDSLAALRTSKVMMVGVVSIGQFDDFAAGGQALIDHSKFPEE